MVKNLFRRVFLTGKKEPDTLPTAIIANNVPAFHNSSLVDNLIARTLAERQWKVFVVTCDKSLEACQNLKHRFLSNEIELNQNRWKENPLTCERCTSRYKEYFDPTISKLMLSNYIEDIPFNEFQMGQINELIDTIDLCGVDPFEHAFSATARFFAKGRPQDEELYDVVYRKFLLATLQTTVAYKNIIKSTSPEVLIAHHGIYVPQGPAIDVAKNLGVRVITWNPGYRKGTFLFVNGDTYHKTMPKMPLRERPLDQKEREKIQEYLYSRAMGTNDWISFNQSASKNDKFKDRFKVKENRKIIAMFTNVFWDAQLHFKDNVFDDMLDWINQTIDWVAKREDIHLFIRAHPAEETGATPSRQQIHEIFDAKVLEHENITIIKSSDDENSYDLAKEAEFSIVYGSKMAGEIAALGKRVLIAGEAWARGKGFTYDAKSIDDYFEKLRIHAHKSEDLPQKKVDLALRYCYQLFFENYKEIDLIINSENNSELYNLKKIKKGALSKRQNSDFEDIIALITESNYNVK